MLTPDQALASVITEIFNPVYTLLVGASIIYFLYGIVRYILDLNNPEKQNLGKSHMLWGGIGLFIVLSVGPILSLLKEILS
jgi:hypothetical protein